MVKTVAVSEDKSHQSVTTFLPRMSHSASRAANNDAFTTDHDLQVWGFGLATDPYHQWINDTGIVGLVCYLTPH